jgi:pantetheine-phosphate adenylyltransferase
MVNKDLYNELETVFLITSPKFAFISSTIIREVHVYGGDVSKYLPYPL